MAAALAAFLLLAPAAAAAAAAWNASAAGLSAVERGLVQDAQPAAWAKECLGYWQGTDSLPNPADNSQRAAPEALSVPHDPSKTAQDHPRATQLNPKNFPRACQERT